jgi:hypothetical protein
MALGLGVAVVGLADLDPAVFDGKQSVTFKFTANGSGPAVVTPGENVHFPLPTVTSCIVRNNLGNPDAAGTIIEFPPPGLLVGVLFSAPLNFAAMGSNAGMTFIFVREGLTSITHYGRSINAHHPRHDVVTGQNTGRS